MPRRPRIIFSELPTGEPFCPWHGVALANAPLAEGLLQGRHFVSDKILVAVGGWLSEGGPLKADTCSFAATLR